VSPTGAALLDACVADAKKQGMKGVAMVTSEKVWLTGRRLLEKHGFECVDTAPPAFSLMVKRFAKGPAPSFAGNREAKARAFGAGLSITRSDQCPYIVDATSAAIATADKARIKSCVVELENRNDVLEGDADVPAQQTVLLVGGTGRTGRRALQQLVDGGISVRAIVRSGGKLPPDVAGNPNLTVIEASLLSLPDEELQRHLAGCDAPGPTGA
jgi:hypothetical protein